VGVGSGNAGSSKAVIVMYQAFRGLDQSFSISFRTFGSYFKLTKVGEKGQCKGWACRCPITWSWLVCNRHLATWCRVFWVLLLNI